MAMRTAIHSLARVHKEIEDVNADFHSLRTVLKETENQFKWNFVMFPNDGALSHLPLIGEIIIPDEYPKDHPYSICSRLLLDTTSTFSEGTCAAANIALCVSIY